MVTEDGLAINDGINAGTLVTPQISTVNKDFECGLKRDSGVTDHGIKLEPTIQTLPKPHLGPFPHQTTIPKPTHNNAIPSKTKPNSPKSTWTHLTREPKLQSSEIITSDLEARRDPIILEDICSPKRQNLSEDISLQATTVEAAV